MATKTITVTVKAYNRLAKLKKENESFSLVIERITKKKVNLMDYFGILSKETGEALERNIEELRKKDRIHDSKEIKKIQKELE